MDVIVIGGGPSGMMAAISASQNGKKVLLLEKNSLLGKKLLITGKGRCNVTSSLPIEEFIKNTPGNGKFLYSSYNSFTNKDIINFLEKQGLKLKEERGNRIFPVTDKAKDVLDCFEKKLKQLNVKILYNQKVIEILTLEDNKIKKVVGVKTKNNTFYADKVILATGGKSYPLTGSTGDGYELAKKIGHTITKIRPSLVPLSTYNLELLGNLQGLSLKNVKIKFVDKCKNKVIYEDFGEMLFTHFGVSGPVILSGSAHLVRYKNIDNLMQNKKLVLEIDFKPALSEEQLDSRILRDFSAEKNKAFKNSLDKLLPQKLIPVIIKLSEIDENKQVNSITKEERLALVRLLKCFEVHIKNFRKIEDAIITSGGINIKEINPKTMESKIVSGLFFAGEVIDVDCYTGGFNLQVAYSTGYVAGS
jgi:predicted Rossmann fold flavoprotein